MRFEPSWKKVERADQHLQCLGSIIANFKNLDPYRLQEELKMTDPIKSAAGVIPAQLAYHYKIINLHPLPSDINVVFGDVIHNLRSALDYIAFDLATKYGANRNFTGFPFHESSENFINEIKNGRLSCVPDALKSVFLATETFRNGKGANLWHLNKLDIIDKHRMLLASEFITGLTVGSPIPGMDAFNSYFSNRNPHGYLCVTTNRLLPNKETKLNFDIVIAEMDHFLDHPLLNVLNQLKNETITVIEHFEDAI